MPRPAIICTGPIWSKKMNGPTICRRPCGSARRTAKPSPRSRTRGTITRSSASHDLALPSSGSLEGCQLIGPPKLPLNAARRVLCRAKVSDRQIGRHGGGSMTTGGGRRIVVPSLVRLGLLGCNHCEIWPIPFRHADSRLMDQRDLSDLLLTGERIVWSGAPGRGSLLTSADTLMIPFSLIWCGFAIFWEYSAVTQGGPFFFRLFGVPFVLVGLYLVAGRFLVDAWIRRGMQYAVTNRRILISRSGMFSKLIAVTLDALPEASLIERANGRGTIRFGQPA